VFSVVFLLFNTIGNKVYKLHYQSHNFFTKSYQKPPAAAAAAAWPGSGSASTGQRVALTILNKKFIMGS
jgi:hypothetical protein